MRTRRRAGQPLAALDAVPAHARRVAGLEGRPHRDGAVRAHRRAAGAADEGSEHLLLLPRSPRRSESPFRLEDDTTWDTNIELGIAWGMRLIEKDKEIYGKSPNAKAFVLVTDGQAWSGEVARSLKLARSQRRPGLRRRRRHHDRRLHPRAGAPAQRHDAAASRRFARRSTAPSLSMIANAGGGEYLELDREGDREIANRIIDATRRRAGSRGLEVSNEELYWRCLLAAAVLPVPRPAVPAGARRALAAGRRRGRGARLRVDADPLACEAQRCAGRCPALRFGVLRARLPGRLAARVPPDLRRLHRGVSRGARDLHRRTRRRQPAPRPRADRHPRPLLFYAHLETDDRRFGGSEPAPARARRERSISRAVDRHALGTPVAAS